MSVKGYRAAKKLFSIALVVAGVIDRSRPKQTCAGFYFDVGRSTQSHIANHRFRVDAG
jgi:hypothetical protein